MSRVLPSSRMPETDDYIEQPPPETGGSEERSVWIDMLFRPVVLTLMMGCLAYSIVDLIQLLVPHWGGFYFILVPMAGSLSGYYLYRFTQRLIPSGAERQKFRFLFLVVALILLKAAGYLGVPWPEVMSDIRMWFDRPWEFFDLKIAAAFWLFLMGWATAMQTARDFSRIGEPSEARSDDPPLNSLSNRFFVGGAALLLITGVSRIGIASLTDLARPPVPGLIINVLLYFALGFILLGQTRWLTLFRHWSDQGMAVSDDLATRWLRYSLVLLGAAALLAFVLPTGYTIPLLDMGSWLIWLMWYIGGLGIFLFHVLLFPLILLLSMLLGTDARRPELEAAPPPESMAEAGSGGLPPWLAFLRSLAFWAVVTAILVIAIRNYLREHPQLAEAVKKFAPLRILAEWLKKVWVWLRGGVQRIQERLPRVSLRRRGSVPGEGPLRFLRRRAETPRERIFREYDRTLTYAGEEGVPRRAPQTPKEYELTLIPEVPEVNMEVNELTLTFIEARYSDHPVEDGDATRAREDVRRIEEALRARRRRQEEASSAPSVPGTDEEV